MALAAPACGDACFRTRSRCAQNDAQFAQARVDQRPDAGITALASLDQRARLRLHGSRETGRQTGRQAVGERAPCGLVGGQRRPVAAFGSA
jgi:ABC-type thiamine transport system ATPase subunit